MFAGVADYGVYQRCCRANRKENSRALGLKLVESPEPAKMVTRYTAGAGWRPAVISGIRPPGRKISTLGFQFR